MCAALSCKQDVSFLKRAGGKHGNNFRSVYSWNSFHSSHCSQVSETDIETRPRDGLYLPVRDGERVVSDAVEIEPHCWLTAG